MVVSIKKILNTVKMLSKSVLVGLEKQSTLALVGVINIRKLNGVKLAVTTLLKLQYLVLEIHKTRHRAVAKVK